MENQNKKEKNIFKTIVEIILKIVACVFSAFCVLLAIGCGISFATVIFLLLAFIVLPIRLTNDFWSKIKKKTGRWIKPAIIIALFVLAFFFVPSSETNDINETNQEMSADGNNMEQDENSSDNKEENENNVDVEQEMEDDTEITNEGDDVIEEETENDSGVDAETDKNTDVEQENTDENKSETDDEVDSNKETESEEESTSNENAGDTTDNVNNGNEQSGNNSNQEYKYAVNNKNGKIHIIGGCSATGDGDNAMTDASYFYTYEEALAYSETIAPDQKKRDCGNCW